MKRLLIASSGLVALTGVAYGAVRLERYQWRRSLTRALQGPWTV